MSQHGPLQEEHAPLQVVALLFVAVDLAAMSAGVGIGIGGTPAPDLTGLLATVLFVVVVWAPLWMVVYHPEGVERWGTILAIVGAAMQASSGAPALAGVAGNVIVIGWAVILEGIALLGVDTYLSRHR